jgi:hypothetical protein
MSPPGNLSLSAQQRDTTRPTLVRNGLAHADTPAKGIGHYITLAAEADVALSTLSPVRRAITRAHAESRRTHAPLPRLVPHGGINRDIIEWMGGYRVIASDGSARCPAWWRLTGSRASERAPVDWRVLPP